MTSLFSWRCAAFLVALVSAPSAFGSSSTTYTYDALGRLRTVTVSGTQTSVQSYDYDAAGNRTLSTSGIVPSVPPSITVPSTSITGSYTISWGASTGTVTAYELSITHIFGPLAVSGARRTESAGHKSHRLITLSMSRGATM
ncbi:MAG: RHS repeat domain-containing protein, partial [Steroidobacteraceae bacterium]